MKTCECCGGDLLRHGITHYKGDFRVIGIRYKCRECTKTFTVRMQKSETSERKLCFNQTGRPHQCDWRMQ